MCFFSTLKIDSIFNKGLSSMSNKYVCISLQRLVNKHIAASFTNEFVSENTGLSKEEVVNLKVNIDCAM
ncbi:transposase [Orientia tsutsugamushi]|uniref:Transposase n=2 Tax=Orientia tsutsugamushi TaxID=784 RepID=A0A2R8EZP3_ORITS|nr:hypothetical protein OTSTA716_1501 [Orientia tsutsugamushi str. TA716]SPM44642.1 transposase [Orientia tsutsugamushi]SPM46449.1 transposase [Orientia tsutsugamushi]